MRPTFDQLWPEYERLLASVRVTRVSFVDRAARAALSHRARYEAVTRSTDVPVLMLATLHMRESDFDFSTNLAQGDPLSRPSTHVPKRRPKLLPGMGFPVTWEFAAIDALTYDGLAGDKGPWTLPYCCYRAESWNGFGPRNHGINSGYLWAGTNHYTRGKYVADGKWNPTHVDEQLGVVPVMLRMIELAPDLGLIPTLPATPLQPVPETPPSDLAPSLITTPRGGMLGACAELQQGLNTLGVEGTPLTVDGSYGRRTASAVRAFQRDHHLAVDGIAGPVTRAAVAAALAGHSTPPPVKKEQN